MITKEELKSYVFADDELHDDTIQKVPDELGPVLYKNGVVKKESLQYFDGEIDWVATLNDLLCMLDDIELTRVYHHYFCSYFLSKN